MIPRTFVFALASLSWIAASAQPASACEEPTSGRPKEAIARALYDKAMDEEASNPEAALADYRCVAKLVDRPAVALRIGAVAERLDRKDEAIAAFEHYLALAGADANDAADMNRHLAQLRRARDEAAQPPQQPPPSPPPPPRPPPEEPQAKPSKIGYGVGIGGVAIAAAGAVFLGVAASENDSVHGSSQGTRWDAGPHGTYDDATRNQTIGVVGLIAGGAIAVVGVVLVATLKTDSVVKTAARGFEVRF